MSRKIKHLLMAFVIVILSLSFNTQKLSASTNRGVSLQIFYDELANYGDWINNYDYGYVWRPNVERDFRPYYSNGHWAMTNYGNTWVSDYQWGWAAFHYGRWFYDDYDGWIWLPDTNWGPAWVNWRTGGGYYGWAPLGPSISIHINVGRKHYTPDNHWVFIPQRCIYYPSYRNYWEPRRNVFIIQNTTIINNIYSNRNVNYNYGPGVDDVRRATKREVPIYRIADDRKPGATRISKDAISIYRPDVIRDDRNAAPRYTATATPRPVRSGDNIPRRRGDYIPDKNTVTIDQSQLDRGNDNNRSSRTDAANNQPNAPIQSSKTERPAVVKQERESNTTLKSNPSPTKRDANSKQSDDNNRPVRPVRNSENRGG